MSIATVKGFCMKSTILAVVTAVSALALVGPASADERTCAGTIGAESLDNVFVPDGKSCTLNGTRLNGNIVIGTGSTLSASGVQVNGNVQSSGARAVYINAGSFVGGSIQLKQGGQVAINGATVNSDVQLEQNTRRVAVNNTRIGSNLQVFQNSGGVILRNNDIAQNLQCKENNPAPTGSGNTAGDKEDQCAAL